MTDSGSPGSGNSEFTDEEFAEFFSAGEPLAPKSRRIPVWARIVGVFVAGAMSLGGVLALVENVRTTPDVREPAEIEEAAWDRVAKSEYGWLVEDILIRPIDTLRVGAFVTNNPPDGVITIDLRPWRDERLDELMDHEIGHLLDFAIWDPRDPERKGGLGTEAWAECAAVDTGIRRTDPRDPGGEYHCFDEELVTYRAALAAISVVCKKWGTEECRSLDE